MVNLLENPEQFKAELKDKWLDYYEANRNWLQALMKQSHHWHESLKYEPEEIEQLGYKDYEPCRPDNCFILGVVSILEPQLKGLFAFAPDYPSELISRLGLDFDPEIELKKRSQQEKTASEYLDEIREEIKT